MRVVVAPAAFAGTLSADEAASAIARGWALAQPGDELRCLPIDDPDAVLAPAPDLVVTGEGGFEFRSLSGTALAALARATAAAGVACIVVAGQVHVGPRVAFEAGVHGAYSAAADAGSVEAAMDDPAGTLERLAAGVAEHWGARPPG